ncbi:TPA: nicotinate-nucleotide--dimethylbenzimidazole phosphoribosyltransferase [Vibrio vulnificus]|nr:nicotinate-nucleotide--dimethylbenzimidazole phosphoribosyltransferase [Vibrio vulnificus]
MLEQQFAAEIQHIIDNKTKPLGALGQLEQVALQLALIQSQGKEQAATHVELKQPQMLLFAGDHGVADEGVSIAPSAVTQQMVLNFLAGGAAINCFCALHSIDLTVVDCGILLPVDNDAPNLILRRLGSRTANFAIESAMTTGQVEQALRNGQQIAAEKIALGADLLMFGEMGIANTSSAAALLSALSGHEVDHCVGRGTGINEEQLSHKIKVVAQGVGRCEGLSVNAILAEVGGFEIVTMAGAFIAAAEHKTPVLVDGFIVSVAAYIATLLKPEVRDYLLFAHRSEEQGHQIVLSLLEAKPLLDLGLRLGEGTGAALAYPLLKAAAQFYNNMASFESAGVTV